MGIIARTSYVIRSKINGVLNRAEHPHETLDYSYEQLRDQLRDVKTGLADLSTQKNRLEIQVRRLSEGVEKHETQARQAVEQDRHDLARRALEKKRRKADQIDELDAQIEALQETQADLVDEKNELQRRIAQFRTETETMKARYEAAEASTRVSEAMTGAGDEMETVSRAIERARAQTEEMEARAAAMEELQSIGAFEDALARRDEIDRELEAVRNEDTVEVELESLKTEAAGEA